MSDVILRIRAEARNGDGMFLTVDEVDELNAWISDHATEADFGIETSPGARSEED